MEKEKGLLCFLLLGHIHDIFLLGSGKKLIREDYLEKGLNQQNPESDCFSQREEQRPGTQAGEGTPGVKTNNLLAAIAYLYLSIPQHQVLLIL